jgi:hypothetical protein
MKNDCYYYCSYSLYFFYAANYINLFINFVRKKSCYNKRNENKNCGHDIHIENQNYCYENKP